MSITQQHNSKSVNAGIKESSSFTAHRLSTMSEEPLYINSVYIFAFFLLCFY